MLQEYGLLASSKPVDDFVKEDAFVVTSQKQNKNKEMKNGLEQPDMLV